MQYLSAVKGYLLSIEVERGLSPETVRSYRSLLRRFGTWVSETEAQDALTFENLRRYQYHEHKRGQRPRSIRATIMALRGFCRWLMDENVLQSDPTVRLVIPSLDAPVRRVTAGAEVDAMFMVVGRIADKRRRALYRALLSTLVYSGLRATEICDLRTCGCRMCFPVWAY